MLRSTIAVTVLLVTAFLAGQARGGLTGDYYQGHSVVDGRIVCDELTLAFTRVDASVQHWDGGCLYAWDPVPGWPHSYTIEWRGLIRICQPGLYGFGTISDDGSEVWIDGELVVANAEAQWYDWEDNLGEGHAGDPADGIELDAGEHEIMVRFYEEGYYDGIELWWLLPDAGDSVIPYPVTNCAAGVITFDPATNWERVPASALSVCPSDVDSTGVVDFSDLLSVLSSWGACTECAEDIDCSGDVGFTDLLVVLSQWGPCIE